MNTTTTSGARGRALNRSELAEVFGVSPSTIDAWRRRGAPVLRRALGRGRGASAWAFDSAAISEWLREQAVRNAIGDLAKIDSAEARRRKVVAEAALCELELAERKGQLVEIRDVESAWALIVTNFKMRLLVLPSKVAPLIAPVVDVDVVRAKLQDEMYEALAELSSEGNMDRVMADLEKHPAAVGWDADRRDKRPG